MGETEAQRGEVICPRSHSCQVVKVGFKPMTSLIPEHSWREGSQTATVPTCVQRTLAFYPSSVSSTREITKLLILTLEVKKLRSTHIVLISKHSQSLCS